MYHSLTTVRRKHLQRSLHLIYLLRCYSYHNSKSLSQKSLQSFSISVRKMPSPPPTHTSFRTNYFVQPLPMHQHQLQSAIVLLSVLMTKFDTLRTCIKDDSIECHAIYWIYNVSFKFLNYSIDRACLTNSPTQLGYQFAIAKGNQVAWCTLALAT